jgi:hypothetical protein
VQVRADRAANGIPEPQELQPSLDGAAAILGIAPL